MRKKQPRRSDCPVSFALDIFGDRWTLLVVRDLMFKGKAQYGDFIESEEKIATNILADRLVALERAGIVKKVQDPKNRTKYIYSLTNKGLDLAPVLVEIILWSAEYDSETAAPRAFLAEARRDRAGLIRRVKAGLQRRAS
jgi:DNA-binding HxlR family transcriptional regulator